VSAYSWRFEMRERGSDRVETFTVEAVDDLEATRLAHERLREMGHRDEPVDDEGHLDWYVVGLAREAPV